jgi:nucleotide-binding universal stress UspA family protein
LLYFFLGSVVHQEGIVMKIILAPVDFSDVTDAVVQAAGEIAKAFQASLYLLHIAPPDPYFVGYEPGPQTVRDTIAQQIHKEQHQLQELESQVKGKGYDVHALLVQGATTEKILQEAKRLEADMIVVGSHGHGALQKLLVGSVAEGILRKAPCPVLIVPRSARK